MSKKGNNSNLGRFSSGSFRQNKQPFHQNSEAILSSIFSKQRDPVPDRNREKSRNELKLRLQSKLQKKLENASQVEDLYAVALDSYVDTLVNNPQSRSNKQEEKIRLFQRFIGDGGFSGDYFDQQKSLVEAFSDPDSHQILFNRYGRVLGTIIILIAASAAFAPIMSRASQYAPNLDNLVSSPQVNGVIMAGLGVTIGGPATGIMAGIIGMSHVAAAQNSAPVIGVNLGNYDEDRSRIITQDELLFGSFDPNGDLLTIQDVASTSGAITKNLDGTFTFKPLKDMNGNVRFDYLMWLPFFGQFSTMNNKNNVQQTKKYLSFRV
jgi:hypothetical protein